MSHPLLYKILEEVTKDIPNPNKDEVSLGHQTVYDSWFQKTSTDHKRPFHNGIDGASDYASFMHTLGIPSMGFFFTVSIYQTLLWLY